MSEQRCPACGGHGQAYAEEWDVHHKMWVTVHQDNGCKPCRGTGYAQCPDCGEAPCLFYDLPCGATERDPLAPRPAQAGQVKLL